MIEYHLGMPSRKQLDSLLADETKILAVASGSRSAVSPVTTSLLIKRFIESWVAQNPAERSAVKYRIVQYVFPPCDDPSPFIEAIREGLERATEQRTMWFPPADFKRGTIDPGPPTRIIEVRVRKDRKGLSE